MSDFWTSIRENSAALEHQRNLTGRTTTKCATCGGRGNTEPSRTDYDAHGSYYVAPVSCRACGGLGFVNVPCSPEVEAAAIEKEIKQLRARLRDLRKRRGE